MNWKMNWPTINWTISILHCLSFYFIKRNTTLKYSLPWNLPSFPILDGLLHTGNSLCMNQSFVTEGKQTEWVDVWKNEKRKLNMAKEKIG